MQFFIEPLPDAQRKERQGTGKEKGRERGIWECCILLSGVHRPPPPPTHHLYPILSLNQLLLIFDSLFPGYPIDWTAQTLYCSSNFYFLIILSWSLYGMVWYPTSSRPFTLYHCTYPYVPISCIGAPVHWPASHGGCPDSSLLLILICLLFRLFIFAFYPILLTVQSHMLAAQPQLKLHG